MRTEAGATAECVSAHSMLMKLLAAGWLSDRRVINQCGPKTRTFIIPAGSQVDQAPTSRAQNAREMGHPPTQITEDHRCAPPARLLGQAVVAGLTVTSAYYS